MANNLSNLQQRLLAGSLGAAGVISAIYYSKWAYAGVFLLIATMILLEFYSLFKKARQLDPNVWMGVLLSTWNIVGMFLYKNDYVDTRVFLMNIPFVLVIFMMELYRKKEQPFRNISVTLFGIIYISLPFMLLHEVVFSDNLATEVARAKGYHYYILMSLLFMIWANDTGAYAFGKLFGKTPLFKRISPNKSWEGAIGGLLFTIGFALLSAWVNPELSYLEWVIFAFIVSVAGVYGDLFESLLKRSLNIKDSGSIIPGHGGFLDRSDSLLLIAPVAYVYLEVIHI